MTAKELNRLNSRDSSQRRRDRNRSSGLCINENLGGTHGPATHGVRCKACYQVHRADWSRAPLPTV